MPKTRLISPGSIPNHRLLKNLQLNDKYLSNDGGDEGIRITDAGLVGIGVTDPDSLLEVFGTSSHLKLSYDATEYSTISVSNTGVLSIVSNSAASYDDIILDSGRYLYWKKHGTTQLYFANAGSTNKLYSVDDFELLTTGADTSIMLNAKNGITQFQLDGDDDDLCTLTVAANGATTIATADSDGEVGHLTLAPDGDTVIDRNTALTATGTAKGLHIDYDHEATVADGQTLTGIGLDLDMNCDGGGANHANSTVLQTGIDIDMVALTAGTQSQTAIDLAVSGSDNSKGLVLDVTGGTTSIGIYIDNKDGGIDFKNVSSADATDYFTINTIAAGATTLSTVDTTVGATAHLNIEPDGHVEFDNCAVGFDRLEATFGAAAVTTAGGDSTDIDFRLGNKYVLELTDNIVSGDSEYLSFIFPNTSGNFLLVIGQDGTGSRAIGSSAAWRAFAVDASAGDNTLFANGTDGVIRWAGGSAPTLTTTADKADIISIYWDADSQTAFAVISQNF